MKTLLYLIMLTLSLDNSTGLELDNVNFVRENTTVSTTSTPTTTTTAAVAKLVVPEGRFSDPIFQWNYDTVRKAMNNGLSFRYSWSGTAFNVAAFRKYMADFNRDEKQQAAAFVNQVMKRADAEIVPIGFSVAPKPSPKVLSTVKPTEPPVEATVKPVPVSSQIKFEKDTVHKNYQEGYNIIRFAMENGKAFRYSFKPENEVFKAGHFINLMNRLKRTPDEQALAYTRYAQQKGGRIVPVGFTLPNATPVKVNVPEAKYADPIFQWNYNTVRTAMNAGKKFKYSFWKAEFGTTEFATTMANNRRNAKQQAEAFARSAMAKNGEIVPIGFKAGPKPVKANALPLVIPSVRLADPNISQRYERIRGAINGGSMFKMGFEGRSVDKREFLGDMKQSGRTPYDQAMAYVQESIAGGFNIVVFNNQPAPPQPSGPTPDMVTSGPAPQPEQNVLDSATEEELRALEAQVMADVEAPTTGTNQNNETKGSSMLLNSMKAAAYSFFAAKAIPYGMALFSSGSGGGLSGVDGDQSKTFNINNA